MDEFSALLSGPRARGAFLIRCLMASPWSIRLADEVPLSVTAVVSGSSWALQDDAPPVQLHPGDVVIAQGGKQWTMAETATTPVTVTIRAGQECYAPDGRRLTEEYDLGVRSWGNSTEPETVLLTGWRLALAADMLVDPDITLDVVARRVGYSTPFALSTAFKREYRMNPRDYREHVG